MLRIERQMAFICEDCYKKKNKEGFWLPISFGRCEVCKESKPCADREE